MNNGGYYDEFGNWVTGYYDDFGNWVEGYFTPDGIWIEGSPMSDEGPENFHQDYKGHTHNLEPYYDENNREMGVEEDGNLFGDDFYEESNVEDNSNLEQELKPEHKDLKKLLIPTVAIILLVGGGYFVTQKINIKPATEITRTTDVTEDVSKSNNTIEEVKEGDLEIANVDFLVSSSGNKVSVYSVVLSPNLTKNQIEELITEEKVRSMPDSEDSEIIVVYLSDSLGYYTVPTLGKATWSQEGFELEIKDKNWEMRPSSEDTLAYKKYLEREKHFYRSGKSFTPKELIEVTSTAVGLSPTEVSEVVSRVESWSINDQSNS